MAKNTQPRKRHDVNKPDGSDDDDSVSLHGLDTEEAIKGIFEVPTPPDARSQKGKRKAQKKTGPNSEE